MGSRFDILREIVETENKRTQILSDARHYIDCLHHGLLEAHDSAVRLKDLLLRRSGEAQQIKRKMPS
jgi:hypothetical protein